MTGFHFIFTVDGYNSILFIPLSVGGFHTSGTMNNTITRVGVRWLYHGVVGLLVIYALYLMAVLLKMFI